MSGRRRTVRRVFAVVLGLYLLGLAWGYVRLPWAAMKSLADFELIVESPAISYAKLDLSEAQRQYLDRKLPPSVHGAVPRIEVSVRWYAVAVARVESSHYVSPTGAEWMDALYVCVFGAWVPVYTFWHVMA